MTTNLCPGNRLRYSPNNDCHDYLMWQAGSVISNFSNQLAGNLSCPPKQG